MGFSKGINKSMTIGKVNGHFDSVRNQSLDQANEGFWALGPVLKCRFYIQVWSGQQIRRKLPLKIVCCSQFPGEGNMPHTQGHRQNQQGLSRGKGVNLRNKQSLSISLSLMHIQAQFLSEILQRNLEIYSFTFKCIRIYFLRGIFYHMTKTQLAQ